MGVHTASLGNATFAKRLVAGVWRTVCAVCMLQCAFPPEHGLLTPLSLHAGTQLAVISYSRQQVPDFDGVAATAAVATATTAAATAVAHSTRGAGASAAAATPVLGARRWIHFAQDLGGQLPDDGCSIGTSGTPAAARAPRAVAFNLSAQPTYGDDGNTGGTSGHTHSHPLAHSPGLLTTRMMLRTASSFGNRSVLCVPPIRHVCQERAAWRTAFRFAGIHSTAFPDLWRSLAHDWPALFACSRPPADTGAAAQLD